MKHRWVGQLGWFLLEQYFLVQLVSNMIVVQQLEHRLEHRLVSMQLEQQSRLVLV
jgi:hypothetical protein